MSDFTIVHIDDLETSGSWRLARRSLDLTAFGMNVVDIAPGDSIPEHDETERDQQEVFFVLGGTPSIMIDGDAHELSAGSMARLDPHLTRTVVNSGSEPARVLIASAPRSSGYEPMDWA